jgi:hypothetical protein
MSSQVQCQFSVVDESQIPHFRAECIALVREWRQCGSGCRKVIAYCDDHGGMERATREMAEHAAEHRSA